MLKTSCPKCGKGEKAELIEIQPNRRYRFRCYWCNIIFVLSGDEDDHKGEEQVKLDRRKHPRFLAQDDTIASLYDGFIRIGEVKDIGLGGLCFEYMKPIGDRISKDESLRGNMFLSVNGFSLSTVACRIVYDMPIEGSKKDPGLSAKPLRRRCGVRFERLAEGQSKQLDFFLKACTKGMAPSGTGPSSAV